MNQKQLARILFASWDERKKENFQSLPVKELQYNRSPAVAPLGVLEQAEVGSEFTLDNATVERHKAILLKCHRSSPKISALCLKTPRI